MVEYAQSWKKKLRIKHLVDVAKKELGKDYNEEDIQKIQQKLDLEIIKKWKLIKPTRKEYLKIVQKILRREYVLKV